VTSVVNRYYDPATDQFLSIDPDVATTDQPYVFTNDDPLNETDALGTTGTFIIPKQQLTNVSKSKTLSMIEMALNGLDLTGKETKALAEEISTTFADNGGKAISSRTANILDAEAGIGGVLSKFAGVGGAVVTLAKDLANHDKLGYSLADTGIQVGSGMAGGAIGAAVCSWAGPGDAACAGDGFAVGLLSSWGAEQPRGIRLG
jgi:hypothetical protein